jgi:tetratricopeptide (TPR) repeat protein
MKLQYIIIATLMTIAAAPILSGAPPHADPVTSTRDLTEDEAADILRLIFEGRPRAALAHADSLAPVSQGHPLYHIVRARCYQQFIPMHDADTDYGRDASEPSLEELDKAIDICKERIEEDDPDVSYYFYRGWAWMQKAYVRSMTRNLFTAGREAKRGKKDLSHYLEIHPDDPTARGLLGSFLYFADTVPNAYKFISKLLLLPTGDREKGLQYLRYSVDHDGLLRNDWRIILSSVYFYFEGRYEEGLEELREFSTEFPEFGTSIVPLAISRPYVPGQVAASSEIVENSIKAIYGAPPREIDWSVLYLVQTFRAYGDRYVSNPEMTRARLRSVIHEEPRHPDWIGGFARLELGQLYASRGETDDARLMFESLADGYPFDHVRDEAKKQLEDMDKYTGHFANTLPPEFDQWIAGVYASPRDSLAALKSHFEKFAAKSLEARFYVGECELFEGNLDAALAAYNRVLEEEAPRWLHTFQMIATTRTAEIIASRGDYEKASEVQGSAMDFYHHEYLVDWVIEGRQRYFKRLADGEETIEPTLLSFIP